MFPVQTLIEPTPASLAAAAGWLGGWAQRRLGDRSFLDRATWGAIGSRIDFEFVAKLDLDIRAACKARRIPPPRLERFFRPRGQALCF